MENICRVFREPCPAQCSAHGGDFYALSLWTPFVVSFNAAPLMQTPLTPFVGEGSVQQMGGVLMQAPTLLS